MGETARSSGIEGGSIMDKSDLENLKCPKPTCQTSCEISCQTDMPFGGIDDTDLKIHHLASSFVKRESPDIFVEQEDEQEVLRCPWCKFKIDPTEKRCDNCNGKL